MQLDHKFLSRTCPTRIEWEESWIVHGKVPTLYWKIWARGVNRIQTDDGKELRKVFNGVLLKEYLDPELLSEKPKIPESVVSKSQKTTRGPKKLKVEDFLAFQNIYERRIVCHQLDADR